MIGHAALLFRTEHGRPPKSLEELADAKCSPEVFGRGKLAHPDGGTYSLSADGMSGVCSRYGRAEALTPCVERLVAALRLRAHDVPGEVAQQIAAGNPGRHGEALLRSRVLDAAFDLEPVPIQVDDANAIADQSASP